MNPIQNFSYTPEQLSIDWSDGRQSTLEAVWLRDHCQNDESRNSSNGQRLMNVTDIPQDISIEQVLQDNNQLTVVFAPESHRSVFSLDWIRDNCYCLNEQADDRSASYKTLWQRDSFPDGLPRVAYDQFCNQHEQKLSALKYVRDYGFVVLEQVPCKPGQVLDVINQFGFVRETNYGPMFEVMTQVDPNNLAFTNLGLGCHLDNPYRDPVPGLQLLHCLESSTSGGESILQDGFQAAETLRRESTQHFATLTQQWINFRFKDKETDLRSRVPFIEVNNADEVIKVRFNNRSIDTIKLPPKQIKPFYDAYRHYAEILEREDQQVSFKMQPGDLMLFDNTRVLHARTAYSTGGTRHLQGAYSDLDGLYSCLNKLEASA
ncbi:MAG: gamma-butyrobetaine dioxygenase [Pseudomonadota bacterium]